MKLQDQVCIVTGQPSPGCNRFIGKVLETTFLGEASEHVLLHLPKLRLLHKQKKDVAGCIESVLEAMSVPGQKGEHRDVTIILSLPGVGQSVAATMLAEASQALRSR